MGFDIAIEDGESLDGIAIALQKLPMSLTEDVHISALKKAAVPLRNMINIRQPEDTGLMAEDLRVAKTRFKKAGEHQVLVGYRKRKDGHGFVAHFHEYGTEKMPARPFMRPSDESTRIQQEQTYIVEIQKEIDNRLDNL